MAAVLVGFALLSTACGEEEPEITIDQRLTGVYGRALTETEVADKLATAAMLCQLDDRVLDGVWRQLNERQLNYQDLVFGHICPERSVFYAGLTGRYVTEEARESGVVTSTTRPPITTGTTVGPGTPTLSTLAPTATPSSDGTGTSPSTAATTPTTAPRATIAPAPTGTAAGTTAPVGEGG